MVFIDADGQKLYLYIASVFGGTTEDYLTPEEAYVSIKHKDSTSCSLDFEFSSTNHLIDKIEFSDLTASFCDQPDYIEKVWGEVIHLTNESSIAKTLKDYYPSLYPDGKEASVDVSSHRVFRISQGDKKSHKCVVIEGIFNKQSNERYSLSSPFKETGNHCVDGIETINWIKVTIDLKSSVLNKPIQFSIVLEKDKIFTPDFTWYFAPPEGHVVSPESYVKIGDRQEKNAIQSVSDETTVHFKEWTSTPESIDERKKSRVLFKTGELVSNIEKLSKEETLAVSLHLDNPQGAYNRQFFVGLLVAFLLSFCSDKTRINDYYTCLHQGCTCTTTSCICLSISNVLTIAIPILLLCSFLSIILAPKKAFPAFPNWRQTLFKWLRTIGIAFTCLLIIYIYCFWLVFPAFMGAHISCAINQWVLLICSIIAFSANIAYLIYCLVFLKRKIYNYL